MLLVDKTSFLRRGLAPSHHTASAPVSATRKGILTFWLLLFPIPISPFPFSISHLFYGPEAELSHFLLFASLLSEETWYRDMQGTRGFGALLFSMTRSRVRSFLGLCRRNATVASSRCLSLSWLESFCKHTRYTILISPILSAQSAQAAVNMGLTQISGKSANSGWLPHMLQTARVWVFHICIKAYEKFETIVLLSITNTEEIISSP
jgi:hypothetical protein